MPRPGLSRPSDWSLERRRRISLGRDAPHCPPARQSKSFDRPWRFLELEDEVDSVLFVGEFGGGGQLVLGIRTDEVDGPYLQLVARAEGTNWAGFPQAAPAFSGKRALALHAFHGRAGTVVVLVDPGVDEAPTARGDLRFRRVEDGVYVARSLTPPGGLHVREEGDTVLLDSFGFGVEQEGPDPSVTPEDVADFSPPPGD